MKKHKKKSLEEMFDAVELRQQVGFHFNDLICHYSWIAGKDDTLYFGCMSEFIAKLCVLAFVIRSKTKDEFQHWLRSFAEATLSEEQFEELSRQAESLLVTRGVIKATVAGETAAST